MSTIFHLNNAKQRNYPLLVHDSLELIPKAIIQSKLFKFGKLESWKLFKFIMQSWKNVVLGATRWSFWAMSFPRKASPWTQLRSKLW